MKFLVIFLVGVIAGGFALNYYQRRETASRPAAQRVEAQASAVRAKTGETAAAVTDSVADKLADWHLTPDDIKRDLAKTGQVVRTKAQAAGRTLASATADARVVTVIKAKYTLDADLSAWSISVACADGRVTLSGTVASPGLIGKAVRLALDTDGVTQVISTLTVKP